MGEPIFRFTMRCAIQDKSGYYHTRWDKAVPVVVLADTQGAARGKAAAMLDELASGYCWVFIMDKIEEVQEIEVSQ